MGSKLYTEPLARGPRQRTGHLSDQLSGPLGAFPVHDRSGPEGIVCAVPSNSPSSLITIVITPYLGGVQ